MNLNIITIIPARGGSKSIPRKNIKMFNGFPLIKYSIDYSKSSNLIQKTIVSTDDDEIASIARELGAEVPFMRPNSLGGDLVQDYPVTLHALNAIEELFQAKVDIIILLRPTSPLRPASLIENGVSLLLKDQNATSVRSVSLSKEHPFRQWFIKDDYITGYSNQLTNELEPYNLPRQELPRVFFQTGDIEIIRRDTLLNGSISGKRILPLFIEADKVFDIDTQQDFDLAENNYEKQKQ
jgi:CMP-N,N'-diacetyllegionaminic acid synthase